MLKIIIVLFFLGYLFWVSAERLIGEIQTLYRNHLCGVSVAPSDNWQFFSVLLIAIFLLKGVVYLTVIPPLEGWDEYQHLAYLSYLDEHNERPVLNQSMVSPLLLEQLVQFPVPGTMLEQTAATGSADYKTFYDPDFPGARYNPYHDDVPLYQAQHGSLYYRIMLPVAQLFANEDQILNKIYTLRIINLACIALSLSMILWLLNHLNIEKKHAAVIGLLLVSQPLLLINSCRVANDAFAIMTGTIVIIIGFLPYYRKSYIMSAVVGILIGISCWAKLTSAILFPFWASCLLLSWYKKELSGKEMVYMFSTAVVMAVIVLKDYFLFNLEHYGMLFVMLEATINSSNNKSFFDILGLISEAPVLRDIFLMWSRDFIWVGGWSFLRVRDISNISGILILFSLFMWGYSFLEKNIPSETTPPYRQQCGAAGEISLLCCSSVFFTSLALGWHYLQSTMAWGQSTTCTWYISLSFPFFLLFIYDSVRQCSARMAYFIGTLLFIVYLYADIRGLLTMLSFYSGGSSGWEALARVASVHPGWLGTPIFFIALILLIYTLTHVWKLLCSCAREVFSNV